MTPLVFEDQEAFLRTARQATGLNFEQPEDDELLMALVEARLCLAGWSTPGMRASAGPRDNAMAAIEKAVRLRTIETDLR